MSLVPRSRLIALACLALIGGALSPSKVLAVPYQWAYDVPTPDEIYPAGLTPRLNNSGKVATGALIRGIAYFDGFTSSYTPTDSGAYVYSINDSSVMAGSLYRNERSAYTPFVATPTSQTYIDLVNGSGVRVSGVSTGINNAGLAVGYYGNPGSPQGAAFTYNSNTNALTTLNLSPVGGRTAFFGVSTTGIAVGTVHISGGTAALTYNPTTNTSFILPKQTGLGTTSGMGLTSTGVLIGLSSVNTISGVYLDQGTPFLYTDSGGFVSLPVPSGWNTATIEGFNDRGDFVGALINGGTRVGYVYSNGAYTILNGANVPFGTAVYTAFDIDDAGNITVTPSFIASASVLSPLYIPEPTYLGLLIPLAFVAARRTRRSVNPVP